jgi:tRNA pseudouridine38-40 synthase
MFSKLSDNVGLKVDDLIVLGKSDVLSYLNSNQDLFCDLVMNDSDTQKIKYGYNQNKQPIKIGYDKGEIQRIIIQTKKVESSRYQAVIQYDGKNFHGFQYQKDKPSIQGIISKLVSMVNNEETLVQGASRTDAFVHAFEQVIHFDSLAGLDENRWLFLFNSQLPKSIYVKSVTKVHPLFHSRYDVYAKEYLYIINLSEFNPFLNDYSWQIRGLDLKRFSDQLKMLVGTHDFTSFAKGDVLDPIRTILSAEYLLEGDLLKVFIRGNGFLRYMVRLIIHYLVTYSLNQSDISIDSIIKEKSRRATKHLAPASGLYLNKVLY